MTTIHSLPIKYDRNTKTYSGELRITKTALFRTSWDVERKHTQVEQWPDGKIKVINHRYTERVVFPKNPVRGTRAWKEARKNNPL